MDNVLLDKIISEYGPLYLFLFIVLVAGWKAIRWSVSNVVVPLVNSQLELVEQLKQSDQTQTNILRSQTEDHREHHLILKKIVENQENLTKLIDNLIKLIEKRGIT